MIQCGDGASLTFELCRERFGRYLDRNRAIEARVPTTVHLSHPAGADRGEDFVGAELRARLERHVLQVFDWILVQSGGRLPREPLVVVASLGARYSKSLSTGTIRPGTEVAARVSSGPTLPTSR